MIARWPSVALAVASFVGLTTTAMADEPPVIPVGLDAYLQWERWPYQRIGARAYMRSTYDRRGGNESALALGRARLRVTWDGRPQPSIDAPVALFYGAGTLYNRDGREYMVKGFPIHVRYDDQRVYLACYFPMPYFKSTFEAPNYPGPRQG